MEQQQQGQYQRWVNLSFFAAAALAAYVLYTLSLKIVGQYDLETRVRNIEVYAQVGALVVGAGIFGALARIRATNDFMSEVVQELARVTWPTAKETSLSTVAVVVMVVISGILLGLLDLLWTKLIQQVL